MADSKYGQLFTEADVRLLMAFAYLEGREGKVYGQVMEGGDAIDRGEALLAEWRRLADDPEGPFDLTALLTFKPDEPLFLLRGQDEAALAGLYGYDEGCREIGLNHKSPHRRGVLEVIRQFTTWQAENATKAPD